MSSLTSSQIRGHILDGVVVCDEQEKDCLKPLVGVYDEKGSLIPTPHTDFIEGGSLDLHLEAVYELVPSVSRIANPNQPDLKNYMIPALIGTTKRRTPEVKDHPLMMTTDDGLVGWAIVPGRAFLVKTVEVVSLPNTIRALVHARTTIFRCGMNLAAAPVHPNYSGQLTFGLTNASPIVTFIEKGARIASVTFWYISGEETDLYQGVWQNGRVSTNMEVERAT